ncbi:MAG: succinate dehydrogenase, hydrophobic membrane anchor protein [Gammaproteobacteria bacterium]|nr:succinate dehydrogenase, hydrophobic membrane anchor protein [Gammaproteobacteria bacterium]
MVTAITNFGRSGLYDWLIQRISAVILLAYTLFIVGFIFFSKDFGYVSWSALFDQFWVRLFSLIALLSTVAHAWIGLWSVITDYLTNRMLGTKATLLRILTQTLLGAVALVYTVWGIEILWGI